MKMLFSMGDDFLSLLSPVLGMVDVLQLDLKFLLLLCFLLLFPVVYLWHSRRAGSRRVPLESSKLPQALRSLGQYQRSPAESSLKLIPHQVIFPGKYPSKTSSYIESEDNGLKRFFLNFEAFMLDYGDDDDYGPIEVPVFWGPLFQIERSKWEFEDKMVFHDQNTTPENYINLSTGSLLFGAGVGFLLSLVTDALGYEVEYFYLWVVGTIAVGIFGYKISFSNLFEEERFRKLRKELKKQLSYRNQFLVDRLSHLNFNDGNLAVQGIMLKREISKLVPRGTVINIFVQDNQAYVSMNLGYFLFEEKGYGFRKGQKPEDYQLKLYHQVFDLMDKYLA